MSVRGFPSGEGRQICAETIRIQLKGKRASAPASVVQPLFLPDLPVFLRWRGVPSFGSAAFESLIGRRRPPDRRQHRMAGPARAVRRARGVFDRVVVSDIAWARTSRWRRQLASLWPGIAEVKRIRVTGTAAQAQLLGGWLRSRLDRAGGSRARAGGSPGGSRDRRQGCAVPSGRCAAAVRPAFRRARQVRARPDLRRSRTLRHEMNEFTAEVKPLHRGRSRLADRRGGRGAVRARARLHRQGRDRRDRLVEGQVDDLSRARFAGRRFRADLRGRSARGLPLRRVQGEHRPCRHHRARQADRVALAARGRRLPRADRAALRRRLARVRPRARRLREVGAEGRRRRAGLRSTTRRGR